MHTRFGRVWIGTGIFWLSSTVAAAPELRAGELGKIQVALRGAEVVLTRAGGGEERFSLSSPADVLQLGRAELRGHALDDGAGAIWVRVPLVGGGEDVLVLVSRGGPFRALLSASYSEEPGPRALVTNLDADPADEILRYRTDELAVLCDGERARLEAQVYEVSGDRFVEWDVPPAPVLGAALAPAVGFVPPAAPATPSAPFRAASSQESKQGPAGLSDGLASTAWVEGRAGAGLGEFVTAQLRGRALVSAVGLTLASAAGVSAPSAVVVAAGNGARGARFRLDLPASAKPGETLWFSLPKAAPASCVSLSIAGVPAGALRVGLGGVRVVTLQELSPAEVRAALLSDLGAPELARAEAALEGLVALAPDPETDKALREAALDPLSGPARAGAAAQALQRRGAARPDDLAAYAALLMTPNERAQRAAKKALLASKEEGAKALAAALPGQGVRGVEAAAALIEDGLPAAPLLAPLLAELGQGAARERAARRAALAAAGPIIEAPLLAALTAPDPAARSDAARVLGVLGARSPRPAVVAALASSLAQEGEFEPRYALLGALVLARPGDELQAQASLAEQIGRETDPVLLARAVEVYGAVPAWPEAPLLLAAKSTDPAAREAAAAGLARRDTPAAREALAALLASDPWEFVRARAAESLGATGGDASLAPLKAALRDPARRVAVAAVAALREAKPAGASAALQALLLDDEAGRERRIEAAAALASLGDAKARAALLKTLQRYRIAASRSQDAEDLAAACAYALGALRAKEAYEEIEAMVIEGPGFNLQYVGVRALAQLGDKRAIPLLKEALGADDPVLVKLAREALRQLEAPPAPSEDEARKTQ